MNLKSRLKNLEKQIEKGKLGKKQTKEEEKAALEKIIAELDYDIEFFNRDNCRLKIKDPEGLQNFINKCQECKTLLCEELKNLIK